jgi:RHS repeat-associated protein
VAAGRIDLAWTASSDTIGVAGYNVYRDAVKVNTVPIGSTSYSDTGLTAGASHTYTVTAVDAAGNASGASTSWSGAAASGAVTTTYTYDTENRLTQLASGGNTIGSYAYDGAGNRYSKTAAGVTTAYSLDLASGLPQVLTETTGSAVTSYAYAGAPLELDRSGTTYWYLSDTLGSVRLVTDSVGASPATYAYSAFGSTRTSTGTLSNEVRFTGERTDTESGLEFLRARTYDPSVGTFLQRDTWGITPTNSQSIDAYAYTENDPANDVDPSGHCGPATPVCVAAGVQVAPWVIAAAGALAALVIGQMAAHPDAVKSAVGATYTVVSAPVGIAGDWVRSGQKWLGGDGGPSLSKRVLDKAKSRVEDLSRDPKFQPPNLPDPDSPSGGGGNPFAPLGRVLKKLIAGVLIPLVADVVLCGQTGDSIACGSLGRPSMTPKPSPSPSPSPSSTPGPGLLPTKTPNPSPGGPWIGPQSTPPSWIGAQ